MELLAGTEILEGVYVMEVTGGWGREGGGAGAIPECQTVTHGQTVTHENYSLK